MNFQKRRIEQLQQILTDPVLELTIKEATVHIYHHLAVEYRRRRLEKAENKFEAAKDRWKADIDTFNFRHQLKKL